MGLRVFKVRVDGHPDQYSHDHGRQLPTEIVQDVIARCHGHFASGLGAAGTADLGVRFGRAKLGKRNQSDSLCALGARTNTDVRKARNSSRLTPRVNWPLYA